MRSRSKLGMLLTETCCLRATGLGLALALACLAGAANAQSTAPSGHDMADHANHATHAAHAAAATTSVVPTAQIPFREDTWPTLLAKGPRPAAYLFTTSYCSTCPAVFELLHDAKSQYKVKAKTNVELSAVMMDVSGVQAQRHAAHFVGMTHLYVFDGYESAIRQSVDPQWPDVTPYVVLIDRKGGVQRILGEPSKGQLKRWLGSV